MSIFYPFQLIADAVSYKLLGLAPASLAGGAVDFFVFDTLKIFFLLICIIYGVSYLRTYLPPEKVRSLLAGRGTFFSHVMAALFGIITPFCTCSAIPLFLGFVQAGVPLGATFSFLVASPMVNEVALIMLLGLFGIKVALIYTVSGVIIAILSGLFVGRLKPERYIENIGSAMPACQCAQDFSMPQSERTAYAKEYTIDILKKVWIYVLVGIGLGAWIHGYVPADFLARYAGGHSWYAVPAATLLGVPLYSNAAGVIPLVGALTQKGVSMGTALAFMMAVTGLSLPEFLILRRVMKLRLILIFAGTVACGIIFTGYLFNYLLG